MAGQAQHSSISRVQVLAMDLRISARRGSTEEGDTGDYYYVYFTAEDKTAA